MERSSLQGMSVGEGKFLSLRLNLSRENTSWSDTVYSAVIREGINFQPWVGNQLGRFFFYLSLSNFASLLYRNVRDACTIISVYIRVPLTLSKLQSSVEPIIYFV